MKRNVNTSFKRNILLRQDIKKFKFPECSQCYRIASRNDFPKRIYDRKLLFVAWEAWNCRDQTFGVLWRWQTWNVSLLTKTNILRNAWKPWHSVQKWTEALWYAEYNIIGCFIITIILECLVSSNYKYIKFHWSCILNSLSNYYE